MVSLHQCSIFFLFFWYHVVDISSGYTTCIGHCYIRVRLLYYFLSGVVRCYDLTHGAMTQEFNLSTRPDTEIQRIWPSPDGVWVACTAMTSSNQIKILNLETGEWWVGHNYKHDMMVSVSSSCMNGLNPL